MSAIKKCAVAALSVSAIGASFTASAQATPEYPSRIVFSRSIVGGSAVDRVQEQYSWGLQTLPSHKISQPTRGFLHHTMGTTQPPGTQTQEITFRFRSSGLFTANPGAHFAVVGRGESTSWYNRGRGLIVGGLGGTANPCAGGVRSQPETWFVNPANGEPSNYVWGGSYCGSWIYENAWYDVLLHVNSTNYFSYTIKQSGTTVGGGFAIEDTVNPESWIINNRLTGFTFGLVFADNPSAPWTLEFSDIKVKWF